LFCPLNSLNKDFAYLAKVFPHLNLSRRLKLYIVAKICTRTRKECFGVKYPLGVQGGGPPKTLGHDKTEINSRLETFTEQGNLELAKLGPNEGDRCLLAVHNQEGICAKIKGTKDRLLIYELQVPLKPSALRLNAIDMKADSVIGFGIESASPESRPGSGGMRQGDFVIGRGPEGPPPGGGDMRRGGGCHREWRLKEE
jgi:hypothetical protein